MRMLKVHIARLWQNLGDDAHNPRYIFAERGLGYRFVRPAAAPFSLFFRVGTSLFG
jgi:DNA-binding response OmpR family regulator